MVNTKLYYFDFPFWKAEVARICFHLANVEIEDVRMSREEWPAVKPTMPFGEVPVLEVDGKWLTQGSAIARYSAKIAGLYPEDAFIAAKFDELLNLSECFAVKMSPAYQTEDEEVKKSLQEALAEKDLKELYAGIVKVFDSVGTGKFFLGEKFCVADIFVWRLIALFCSGFLAYFPSKEEQLKDYPRLSECLAAIQAEPKIKEWMEKNPDYYPKFA